MTEVIFCNSCGNGITINTSRCSCGNIMTFNEMKDLSEKFSKIEKYQLIKDSPASQVQLTQDELPLHSLSKKYFLGSSAKSDYEKKVSHIQKNLIPQITEWKEIVQNADEILAKDKVELYGKLLGITDFAIREFFGPFALKASNAEMFEEYRDFSKYELSKVMNDYSISLDDIQTTNFETIGIDVFNSINDTLHNGSFLELAEKDEFTDDDFRKVKGELGVAIAGELIKGIGNLIGENIDAIGNVREADSKLNEKLSHISKVIQSLSIEEQEINKRKTLFDKSDLIVETCYNKILKPIVDELKRDPIYLEYKLAREPYDLQQNKIEIENQALKIHSNISFWKALLNNSKKNFNHHLNKRLTIIDSLKEYDLLNKKLKDKRHKSLKAKNIYEEDKTELFREYELENRRILREVDVVKNNKKTVTEFFNVLKIVKENVIK
ncbi:hypothetical protein ESY86_16720 [Subsaximicrobium wynnwilliamsii]|uniref:Uncharacterized protein n=1 Tax=Subsaximicrobium wynnwilliamsii TaxID=291179 RepID=A0A5C6ZEH7_9FLAO|nr:hypothetical protein [Subsaximicrobium wynnwilliamsii]TXD81867.1 hypothetical protein ESY87_16620 [Subsaximicrobium wynnwilliamsii]TXD87536.1 hypothetical protein ESY86_16720 [Subsaximicrobium wynnwilliamsii]TXE01219.1 hypothetical protein ESY88_16970 [Subsaximicrobium wynnwilliamsii]